MGVPKTSDGKPIFSIYPTEGSRTTIVTHNWCDKTTWYQKSTRVVAETLSAVIVGETYSTAHEYLIDTLHGKLWDENSLKDSAGNSYRVAVFVDGVQKQEVDPHTNEGDFSVNYELGVITFSPTIATNAVVTATYHYAGGSTFTIKPAAGKKLMMRTVEVQFSSDVEMNDTVIFEPYGYVDVFAPQYLQANGGPYPPGTLVPLGATVYKTMLDFQAESNGAMPKIPAIGGTGWRGIQNEIIVFPWDYAAMITVSSAAGMEIRMRLEHDTPFGGEFGTATVYCLSDDED